jgi:hypothetical protein
VSTYTLMPVICSVWTELVGGALAVIPMICHLRHPLSSHRIPPPTSTSASAGAAAATSSKGTRSLTDAKILLGRVSVYPESSPQ